MIRLIASDMDGTLLNDKIMVSAGNAAAIRRAQKAGIEFMVATGRERHGAMPLLEAHNLKVAYITLNGAKVFDAKGRQHVDVPVPKRLVKKILTLLDSYHLYYEIVTDHGIYSISKYKRIQNVADNFQRLNPNMSYKLAVARAASRGELMNVHYVERYEEVLADDKLEVMKILAFSAAGAKVLAAPKRALSADPELVVTGSGDNNIEINHINAQKGLALKTYITQKGGSMANVMAIGDNLNDESMIKMAKYSVAMANAVPRIKQAAWWVTKSNREDGVAAAIDKAIALNQAEAKRSAAKTEMNPDGILH